MCLIFRWMLKWSCLCFLSLKAATLGGKRNSGSGFDTKITSVFVTYFAGWLLKKRENMPEEITCYLYSNLLSVYGGGRREVTFKKTWLMGGRKVYSLLSSVYFKVMCYLLQKLNLKYLFFPPFWHLEPFRRSAI